MHRVVSPPIPVATITVRKGQSAEDFDELEEELKDEGFNVWNTDTESPLMPLGSLNWARKSVYKADQKGRGCPLV